VESRGKRFCGKGLSNHSNKEEVPKRERRPALETRVGRRKERDFY